jgi:hypothetical protein
MNFQNLTVTFLALLTLAMLTTSCNVNDSSDPDLELIPIESVSIDSYTVSLESDNPIETGANTLYWKVERDGDIVTPQSISINPMMDMGTMQHSTPYDQPETADEDDRYFTNMAVFIMPSGSMGSWSISFEINLPNNEVLTGIMPVEVGSSWRLTSVRDADDAVYFITWLKPRTPVTGANDLQFMVHTRESMMSFPPAENVEMEIYPYMDMGGGSGHSTDFTPPEPAGNGHFTGDINYSMSGTWTTSVTLTVDGNTLPEAMFEYSVLAQ